MLRNVSIMLQIWTEIILETAEWFNVSQNKCLFQTWT